MEKYDAIYNLNGLGLINQLNKNIIKSNFDINDEITDPTRHVSKLFVSIKPGKTSIFDKATSFIDRKFNFINKNTIKEEINKILIEIKAILNVIENKNLNNLVENCDQYEQVACSIGLRNLIKNLDQLINTSKTFRDRLMKIEIENVDINYKYPKFIKKLIQQIDTIYLDMTLVSNKLKMPTVVFEKFNDLPNEIKKMILYISDIPEICSLLTCSKWFQEQDLNGLWESIGHRLGFRKEFQKDPLCNIISKWRNEDNWINKISIHKNDFELNMNNPISPYKRSHFVKKITKFYETNQNNGIDSSINTKKDVIDCISKTKSLFDNFYKFNFLHSSLNYILSSNRIKDINTVKQLESSRNILIVWKLLSDIIYKNYNGNYSYDLSLPSNTPEDMIKKAQGFEEWCQKNAQNLSTINTLNLMGKTLTMLPEQIKYLTGLKNLCLSENYLAELPNVLFGLRKLNKIDLSVNHIKNIPAEITQLTKLKNFNLKDNYLTSIQEILTLKKLSNINVKSNILEESAISILKNTFPNVFPENLIKHRIYPQCLLKK